jgi:DNA-binding CsgD family transcriptional regulator
MKIPNRILPGLNPEVVHRLSLHQPRLSDTEINVAGLVHLGYTSREIAQILGCSVRNIENHRYRLGKKLQIDWRAAARTMIHSAVR